MTDVQAEELDPGRWITLGVAVFAAFIVVLDNTVLNVSIPTILRELHTTLPALQWVITGYALTFAALLIIGGRLGDVFGHQRVFVVGFALFGIGSFIASVSTSVGQLIVGEAIIEGIGASLMMPTSIAILSGTFKGRERATAFAAWGATAGIGAALGPVVGGFLTTNYSWRWSFRINVIVAPIAIIGAVLFIGREPLSDRRVGFDIPGAFLVASGMFLLVFALSQGGVYGWWAPIHDVTVAGHLVWPASRAVSMIPLVLAAAIAVLVGFVALERRIGRAGGDPLIQLDDLQYPTYRYGLITALIVSMGQLGLSFVLPVFLQDAKHLTAATNGLWMLPSGLCVIVGSQLGGRLINRLGPTVVVRLGLLSYTAGVLVIVHAITLDITVWRLLPGFVLYGVGVGFAVAQLTNIILAEIPFESTGVAGGTNSTVRQVGSALGVSIIGSLLAVQTIRSTTTAIRHADLPTRVKAAAIDGIHARGTGYVPGRSSHAAALRSIIEHGVTSGTRVALLFAAFVLAIGAGVSFLIPNLGRPGLESGVVVPDGVEPDLGGG
ncbi:MAG: putative transport protein [Actinomycetia bacterium]|nr:putative transport protein [Actinomycetes bacterium]